MNNTIQHTSIRLLLALLLGFFATDTANAQITANEVQISNIESYVQDGSLYVSFDLALEGDFLSSGDALFIYPEYSTELGEIALPGIVVNGKQRARFYRREQALLSESERMKNKPFAVIERNNKETQHVSYNYEFSVTGGVSEKGTLHIDQLLHDCCNLSLVATQVLAVEYRKAQINAAMFANTVTYITPQAEKEKKRNDHIVVRIDYPVNKFEVLPNFADNKAELERMDKEVKPLFTDKGTYKIESAVIKGFASPEDTYAVNYINGVYQFFKGDYLLQFDGKRATGVFAFKTDKLLEHNLLGQLSQQSAMEDELKAIIQQYMTRMNGDGLVVTK